MLLAQEGMSDAQREVVVRAGKSGEVSFDDYHQAVMATIECLKDAGLNPHDVETITTGGQPLIVYVIGSNAKNTDAVNDELIDSCAHTNSDAVEQLYARNPGAAGKSIEAQDANFGAEITACLEAGGYHVSEAEGETWRDVAGRVIYEQTDNATAMCILDTGVADHGLVLPKPPGD